MGGGGVGCSILIIPIHLQSISLRSSYILHKQRLIPFHSPENRMTPSPLKKYLVPKNLPSTLIPPSPHAINVGCSLMQS